MSTWRDVSEPALPLPGLIGWLRAVPRLLAVGATILLGLVAFFILRLVELPFGRMASPRVVQIVCRIVLPVIGLRLSVRGKPSREPAAVVANHAGWMDIFTLGAADRIFFVAKNEVAHWPGIGFLARVTGSLFVERRPAAAGRQRSELAARLRLGDRVLFFPEGTSSDGLRILPFKSSLFAAFLEDGLRDRLLVQPVAVRYHAPGGQRASHYAWWGDMDFGRSLLEVFAAPGGGRVEVAFCAPVRVAAFSDRKELARVCEAEIRRAFEDAGPH